MPPPMFLDFYKLREQPFGDTPDPRYVFLSKTHREALASLFYGIKTGRGFLALIAEPGMGKTTLLFHLLEHLRSSVRTAFLFQTQCSSHEVVRYLLADLGIDASEKDLPAMHEQLKKVLIAEASAGKRLVVFIDEAQNLTEPVLETVRLLSDFENPGSKLIQIVLAGQLELAEKLARPALAQLRQRISILGRLNRFTRSETDAYIDHRLGLAGYKGDKLFQPEARAMISAWSKGIPRNINNLCFNILTLGCALGRKEIDCSLVQEAVNDLEVNPVVSKPQDSPEPTQPVAAVSPVVPLHAHGGERDEGPSLICPSLFSCSGFSSGARSRTIALVGAIAVFLFAIGAAGDLFVRRGTEQPRAAGETSPLPVQFPVSPALNTAQGVTPANNGARVASRPASREDAAEKAAWIGQVPEGEALAPLATETRPAVKIDRDPPLDLTAEVPHAPTDAIEGVLPAISGNTPILPPNPEQIVPCVLAGI